MLTVRIIGQPGDSSGKALYPYPSPQILLGDFLFLHPCSQPSGGPHDTDRTRYPDEQALLSRVYDVVTETDLQEAHKLGKTLGARVWLKQGRPAAHPPVQTAGAYQKIISLPEEDLRKGIITVSAGNHAQGVAYTAQHLGIRAVVVMPVHAPLIKVQSVRDMGAEVVLHGQDVTEAEKHAWELQKTLGLTFIHPYDDLQVIAGQATIGLELLKQVPRGPFTVFVPVGGGG